MISRNKFTAVSIISIVAFFALSSAVLAAEDWVPGTITNKVVKLDDGSNVTKWWCAPSPDATQCCDGNNDYEAAVARNECVWLSVPTGPMRPNCTLPTGRFQILGLTPTADLWTPAALRYVMGYSIHSVDFTTERRMIIIFPDGRSIGYRFPDGESVGVPLMNMNDRFKERILMVDSEGWATATDPAYYDLYTGEGERYRFMAAKVSEDYLQLVSYLKNNAREETMQDFDTELVRDSAGSIRQVLSPSRLSDIIVHDNWSYSINLYDRRDVLAAKDTNGYYQVAGTAEAVSTFTVDNPDTSVMTKFRATEVIGSRTNTFEYEYISGVEDWTLTEAGGLKSISKELYYNDDRTEIEIRKTTKDINGNIFKKTSDYLTTFPWGMVHAKSITDPDGLALTRTFGYYTDTANLGYGRLKSISNANGSWTRYNYASATERSAQITPWMDTSITVADNDAVATYYDYTPHTANELFVYNDRRPRTVTKKILGITLAKTFHSYSTNSVNEITEIQEQCSRADASYGDSDNLRTTTILYGTDTANHQVGRIKTKEYSGGKLESYTYEYGNYITNSNPANCTFQPDTAGSAWRETIIHGTTNSLAGIANKTTKQVTIKDSYSQEVLKETYIYNGTTYQRIAWTVNEFGTFYKPATTYKSNGTKEEAVWASCGCGKESEIDAQGMTTEYQYDALNRLDFTSKELGTNVVITTHTYDAADRRLSTTTTAGPIITPTTTKTYDTAGRITTSTDSLGIQTAYSYNGLANTTTRAGITNTTVRYLDGRTHYTTQNGIRKQTYTYGVNPDGTRWTKTYTGSEGTNSPAWSKTTTDMLGRTIKTEQPGYGGTTIISESFYNNKGQLIKTTTTSLGSLLHAPSIFEYNALGQQIRTAQDINNNGTIDLAGPDRVTESDSSFQSDGTDYWMTSISKIYAQDNGSAVTTNSIRKTRLTGLSAVKTSEQISIDINGNQTVSTTEIDRDNKTVTQLVDAPDSTNDTVSITINGLLTSSTGKTGLTTTYTYDALGRRTGVTDGRTTIQSEYDSKGHLRSSASICGLNTYTTTYAYDPSTGRRTSVTNSVGEATHYYYSAEGQLLATWGNTYPVAYEYGDYDRMSAMYTLRDTNIAVDSYSDFTLHLSHFDRTAWLYDEPTGLLTNKLYAENQGPSYTYTPDGKLNTRTWARGTTTTYAYDTCCGSLTNISYSDSTPTVSFTHDRLGRQQTITDATGTREFTYNDALQLASETNTLGTITRTYDALGRNAGFSTGADYAINYGYDSLGRFHLVSSSLGGSTNSFEYSYLPNSSLISSISNSVGLVALREYEDHRNLITEIKNQFDNTTISQYNYTNDEIGRRTQRIDTPTLPEVGATTNTFGYNSKSELISAALGLDSYDYDYDEIGNRTQSVVPNNQTNSYYANSLNQYTNITNGTVEEPLYDLDGNMTNYNGWAYTWNGENRLVTASNATTSLNFAYDYMGRRFQKITADGTTTATNTFLYDGWNPISETITSSTTNPSTNSYIWGLDLSGSLQGAGGIGGLLAVAHGNPEPAEGYSTYFPAYDANGNITEYTDTNGTIVAHYEYDPFGNTKTQSGAKADDFNFRFSTKYFDAETGFYYYGYRYYSPELGRWLNRDPIAERGGLNVFGFVRNSPLGGVDKLGLAFMISEFVQYHASAEYLDEGPPREQLEPSYAGQWDGGPSKGRVSFSKPGVYVDSSWGNTWSYMVAGTDTSKTSWRPYSATHLQWSSFLTTRVHVCGCCPLGAVRVDWIAFAEMGWGDYGTEGRSVVEINNVKVARAARGVGPVISPQTDSQTGSLLFSLPPNGCDSFIVLVGQDWWDAGSRRSSSGGTFGVARFSATASCVY